MVVQPTFGKDKFFECRRLGKGCVHWKGWAEDRNVLWPTDSHSVDKGRSPQSWKVRLHSISIKVVPSSHTMLHLIPSIAHSWLTNHLLITSNLELSPLCHPNKLHTCNMDTKYKDLFGSRDVMQSYVCIYLLSTLVFFLILVFSLKSPKKHTPPTATTFLIKNFY